MSKQINTPLDRRTIRRQLLATVSAAALTAWSAQAANAAAADHPQIWIEFGGDASAVSGEGQPFTAPFMTTYASSPVFDPVSPTDVQRPPRYSFGGEAAISFQPEDSNWIFSAAVRYGRSSSTRNVHQQTNGFPIPTDSGFYKFFAYYYHRYIHDLLTEVESFSHDKTHHSERHEILDFTAGKDVGLGMFGKDSTSVISAGVRMTRFDSNATVNIWARPNASVTFSSYLPKYYFYWRDYHLSGNASRSFHGLGPTVSWNGSVPLAGNLNDGELAFDWGVNAALLFGKQTAKIHHSTSAYHGPPSTYFGHVYYNHTPNVPPRSRSVTVPNVGGSVGISYQFTDAKLSLGYRADYFFGAMDGGIDAAKKTTLSFNGPYASISIGLGD